MRYLTYLLISKTQYNIHSPYLFKLYCEIINSTIPNKKLGITHPRRDDKITYKLANTFQPKNIYISSNSNTYTHSIINNAVYKIDTIATTTSTLPPTIDMAIITSIDEWNAIKNKIHNNSVVIWQNQHRNKQIEQEYEMLKKDSIVKVTLDMYSIAIVLFLPRLHKENYILR